MARMLAYISWKVSKNTAPELMQILKDDSFDKQMFNDMFNKSSDFISFMDNVFQQEMNHQGFRSRTFIISGRSVVGLLPTEYENKGTKILTREIKMEMLQKAISRTFESLRNVAMEKFKCQTADGNVRKCYLGLQITSVTYRRHEAWHILGVKGRNSSFPCHRCVVPKELLSIPI